MENGSVAYNNDSPTYTIHYPTSTNKSSDVSCCGKDDPPLSMVEDIDKGSKGSDGVENEYDGIQNLETTGSDTVGDNSSVHQDDTLTLQFIEKK